MKKLLIKISIFTILYLFLATPTQAACNFHSNMTSTIKDISSWTTTCTIATDTIEGIDEGTSANTASLTIGSGGAITINANAQLIAGSLSINGGTIAIQDTGTIKIGDPIYVTDSDSDGWAANFTLYNTAATGRRRLALMNDYTTTDCNDSDNTSTAGSIMYADNDGDGYGAGAASYQCANTAGYVSNNSDCYDNNANAKPGSTTCSTTHRGDGSYDYDCSSEQTACGTGYYYPEWYPQICSWSSYLGRCNCSSAIRYVSPTSPTVACGTTGYSRGTYYAYDSNCNNNNLARYRASTLGTQSCQ